MLEHPDIGDNHNAPVFHWCYKRMGEFIPQLLGEGSQPRIMLEYSGTLLHGLRAMGLDDVFDALRPLTCDPELRQAVEWLGCPWGHAVAPSTPVQDYRLHVRAWQHHFAAIFGLEALGRVRGFSPAEMALPNHPDVAYEFVRTLNDCGYQWVLVQEHTVELPDGRPLERPHLPHRLVVHQLAAATPPRSWPWSRPRAATPSWSARCSPTTRPRACRRLELAGRSVPPLVTQIADGENGGVMMNEFPPKYLEVVRECSGSRDADPERHRVPGAAVRHRHRAEATCRPSSRCSSTASGSGWHPATAPTGWPTSSSELARQDSRFHVEGGSWTNDLSWVRGYDQVLIPMERASSLFHERILAPRRPRRRPPLPHGAVPPAGRRDQLLPLLGRGRLDRLRRRAVPSRRRHPHAVLTPDRARMATVSCSTSPAAAASSGRGGGQLPVEGWRRWASARRADSSCSTRAGLADRRTRSPPFRRVQADALVRTSTPAESIKIMPRRSSTM